MTDDDVTRRAGSPNDPDYGDLHVITMDALKYAISWGPALERAAHEVLVRLRNEGGLPIPPRMPDDPFDPDGG